MTKNTGYETSRDMKRLKQLLDEGYEVVCFYTYDFLQSSSWPHEPVMTTDVCVARFYEGGVFSHYSISCRGHEFESYFLNGFNYGYTFLDLLEARDIEFIEPTITKEK